MATFERLVVTTLFAILMAPTALASDGEEVRFHSAGVPPTPFQVRRAKAKGLEITTKPGDEITATIRKPDGVGPVPAIVLLHSCRGVLPYQHDWAKFLTDSGFITLLVDSFSPRGETDACNSAMDVVWAGSSQSADAYGALQFLSAIDGVDNNRVGLLGWGWSPIVGSMESDGSERFYDRKFSAAVGLYIACDYFTSGLVYAPTLLVIAGKDEWRKPGRCAASVETGQENGSPIWMVQYPDAMHGFDDMQAGESTDLDVPNLYNNPPHGVTIGYSADAHVDAKEKVMHFFRRHLNAK